MTDPRIRVRRLSRMAMRAQAEVAGAERALATAAREAAGAAARSESIAGFIGETSPTVGEGEILALLAGAHLRQLLRPAATAAERARAVAFDEQRTAEQRLAAASVRADRLKARLGEARRKAADAAERRRMDMTPAARRRR